MPPRITEKPGHVPPGIACESGLLSVCRALGVLGISPVFVHLTGMTQCAQVTLWVPISTQSCGRGVEVLRATGYKKDASQAALSRGHLKDIENRATEERQGCLVSTGGREDVPLPLLPARLHPSAPASPSQERKTQRLGQGQDWGWVVSAGG